MWIQLSSTEHSWSVSTKGCWEPLYYSFQIHIKTNKSKWRNKKRLGYDMALLSIKSGKDNLTQRLVPSLKCSTELEIRVNRSYSQLWTAFLAVVSKPKTHLKCLPTLLLTPTVPPDLYSRSSCDQRGRLSIWEGKASLGTNSLSPWLLQDCLLLFRVV